MEMGTGPGKGGRQGSPWQPKAQDSVWFFPLKFPPVQPWFGKGFPTNFLSPKASFTCCHQHTCSSSQITSAGAAAWLFLALLSPQLLQTSPAPFLYTFLSRLSMLRVNRIGLKRNLLQRPMKTSAGNNIYGHFWGFSLDVLI